MRMDVNSNGGAQPIEFVMSDRSESLPRVSENDQSSKFEPKIVWKNVILQIILHSFIFWEIRHLIRHPDQLGAGWTLLKWGEF